MVLVNGPVQAAGEHLAIALAEAAVQHGRCMCKSRQLRAHGLVFTPTTTATTTTTAMRVVKMHVLVPRGDEEPRRGVGGEGERRDCVRRRRGQLALICCCSP